MEEEISGFDKGKNDELLEIVKKFRDCKDIMAFSQIDKKSNFLIKDNIRYILTIFIASLPEAIKTYWEQQMMVINDKTKTNDQIYQQFVNTCLFSAILDSRRYQVNGDPQYYINQNTPFPQVKTYLDKYNYAMSVLHFDDNTADAVSWWTKERTLDNLKALNDIYLRYKDTAKEFPPEKTFSFIISSEPHNIRDGLSYEENFARILQEFREIYDTINYDEGIPDKFEFTFFLMRLLKDPNSMFIDDAATRKRIVNRAIHLYNTMVTTDPVKANMFINKFLEKTASYAKLLSKPDTDEELIPWLGGKKKNIKRKTSKRKTRKTRKSIKTKKSRKMKTYNKKR